MTSKVLYKRINLIPKELKLRQRYPLNKIISTCVFFSLIAAGLIYLYQITSMERIKNEIAAYQMVKGKLTKEKTDLESALLFLDNISEKERDIAKIAKAKAKIFEQRVICSDVMKTLTHSLPPALWLNQIYVTEEEVKQKQSGKPEIIKSIVLKGESLGNSGITDLMMNLEDSQLFSQVGLEYGEKKRAGSKMVFDFEIKAQLKR
jgi:Tfp pilus assembly protein PilN